MKKKILSIVAGLFLIAGMAVFVPQVKANNGDIAFGCIWTSCSGTWCDPAFKNAGLAALWIDFIEDNCP